MRNCCSRILRDSRIRLTFSLAVLMGMLVCPDAFCALKGVVETPEKKVSFDRSLDSPSQSTPPQGASSPGVSSNFGTPFEIREIQNTFVEGFVDLFNGLPSEAKRILKSPQGLVALGAAQHRVNNPEKKYVIDGDLGRIQGFKNALKDLRPPRSTKVQVEGPNADTWLNAAAKRYDEILSAPSRLSVVSTGRSMARDPGGPNLSSYPMKISLHAITGHLGDSDGGPTPKKTTKLVRSWADVTRTMPEKEVRHFEHRMSSGTNRKWNSFVSREGEGGVVRTLFSSDDSYQPSGESTAPSKASNGQDGSRGILGRSPPSSNRGGRGAGGRSSRGFVPAKPRRGLAK